MLLSFPDKVRWYNNKRQRLLSLSKAVMSLTVWMTLLAMTGVLVWRGPDTPQKAFDHGFRIFVSIILVSKIGPAIFDLWRMFLWTGRALFRPKGTQGIQMIAASLMTFCWISLIVAIALTSADPVFRFFKSMGISIHV